MLTYYGILGASFFVYLLWTIFSTLLKSPNAAGDNLEYWRPYFLAGFASILVVNLFNSYFFDRVMFIIIGFAAALEHGRRDASALKVHSQELNSEPRVLHDWASQEPLVRHD
jgi:hypothetical protein